MSPPSSHPRNLLVSPGRPKSNRTSWLAGCPRRAAVAHVLAEAVAHGAASVDGARVLLLPVEEAELHWDELKWRDKIAGGFTNSASQSGDKLNTLVDLVIFAMQHGMIWVASIPCPATTIPREARTT